MIVIWFLDIDSSFTEDMNNSLIVQLTGNFIHDADKHWKIFVFSNDSLSKIV